MLTEAYGRPVTDAEIRPYWLDVIDANRDRLISPGGDPNLIYPDQNFEILLPPLPAEIGDHGERAITTPFPVTSIGQEPLAQNDLPQPDPDHANPADTAAIPTIDIEDDIGPVHPSEPADADADAADVVESAAGVAAPAPTTAAPAPSPADETVDRSESWLDDAGDVARPAAGGGRGGTARRARAGHTSPATNHPGSTTTPQEP